MALKKESKIYLNDGVSMPLFGIGVWRMEPGRETREAVTLAFELVTYILIRHPCIITKRMLEPLYRKQPAREKLFITSKVHLVKLGMIQLWKPLKEVCKN
ncbi:MAG: hypothetical protein CM1200mP30_00840 [Pseudomonadota bacterium]|nr:MAG: hypothetical protein CM1200mP30_00840 [Pseudomonadota bacterium]